jgi:hypothetical protein
VEVTVNAASLPTESDYFALDDQLRDLYDVLVKTTDPAERARLLYKLFQVQQHQAKIHTAVFGPDPIEDEGGRDLAESLGYSAILYGLLADVEKAVAYPRLGRRNTTTPLEPHAGAILDQMAQTPDLGARMRLLKSLDEAVDQVIGPQAAETLWHLPAPGWSGPLTVEEKDAWLAEQGMGNDVETFDRAANRAWPWLLFALTVAVTIAGAVFAYLWWESGSLLLAGISALVAVITPTAYVKGRLSQRRFLTEDDNEDDRGAADAGYLDELDD